MGSGLSTLTHSHRAGKAGLWGLRSGFTLVSVRRVPVSHKHFRSELQSPETEIKASYIRDND